MWSLLAGFRPLNLGIMLATQILLLGALLGFDASFVRFLGNGQLLAYLASTLLVAAAGYVWNDLADRATDAINRPDRRTLPRALGAKRATEVAAALAGVGFGVALGANVDVGPVPYELVYIGVGWALYFYAYRWKCTVLLGNLVVSLLCGLLVVTTYFAALEILPTADPERLGWWFIFLPYAAFAFALTLLRELVKDLEDLPGDTAAGCATLPVRFGVAPTRHLIGAYALMLLLVFLVVAGGAFWWEGSPFRKGFFFLLGLITFIQAEILFRFYFARNPENLRTVSNRIKGMMLLGLVALYFLRGSTLFF